MPKIYKHPLNVLGTFTYQEWEGSGTIAHLADLEDDRYYLVDDNIPLPVSESASFELVELTSALCDTLEKLAPEYLKNKVTMPISVDQLKLDALTRIDQAHAEFLLKAVGNPTQVEINTWPLKLEIKNAILAELPLNQEQQAFVDSAGLDTPAKQNAWAHSVQAKSAYSAHATGVAEAVRDTAKEMVKAAETAEELEAVMQQLTALAEQKLAEVLALKG